MADVLVTTLVDVCQSISRVVLLREVLAATRARSARTDVMTKLAQTYVVHQGALATTRAKSAWMDVTMIKLA